MIFTAKTIMPVSSEPIDSGAIAFHGDKISKVGRIDEVKNEYPHDEIVDYEDCIIIPGLVNVHSHIELETFSDLAEPTPFTKWLRKIVKRSRSMSENDWLESARQGAKRLIDGGVTAIGDISRWGSGAIALKEAGLHGVAFHEVVAVDELKFASALENLLERMGSFKKGHGRYVGISPHAPYSLSSSVIKKLVRLANSMDAPFAIHVAETEDEVKMITWGDGALSLIFRPIIRTDIPLKGTGMSPVAYLDSLGAIGERTIAVHCVHLSEEDISILKKRGAAVALCPSSNELLGVGEAPVAAIVESGCRYAPATDSAASNPQMDLFDQARALVRMSKEQRSREVIGPSDALRAMTLGAAAILGIDSEIGSLEPGKFADFAIVSAPRGTDRSDIITWATRDKVLATVLSGRIVYSKAD